MDNKELPALPHEARKVLRAHVLARIENRKDALCGQLSEADTARIRTEIRVLKWLATLCDNPDAPAPHDEDV